VNAFLPTLAALVEATPHPTRRKRRRRVSHRGADLERARADAFDPSIVSTVGASRPRTVPLCQRYGRSSSRLPFGRHRDRDRAALATRMAAAPILVVFPLCLMMRVPFCQIGRTSAWLVPPNAPGLSMMTETYCSRGERTIGVEVSTDRSPAPWTTPLRSELVATGVFGWN
jgi:hypothetical protein